MLSMQQQIDYVVLQITYNMSPIDVLTQQWLSTYLLPPPLLEEDF